MMGKLPFAKLHILNGRNVLNSIWGLVCKMFALLYRVISKEEFLGEPAGKSPSRRGSYVEKEAKADLAFKVFDRNHDGYITKEEMLKGSKNLTKKQVK